MLGLFGENKTLPEHASPRIQRWAITLTAYNYELNNKPGSENSADSLSRLPLKNQSLSYIPEDVFVLFTIMDNSNINVNDIKGETQKDECLIKVYEYCKNGWPEESVNDDFRPYKVRKMELSLKDGEDAVHYQSELPKQSICNLINDYGDMAISNAFKENTLVRRNVIIKQLC